MSDAALAACARRLKASPFPRVRDSPWPRRRAAARFILRGGEGARLACGIAFGAEPPRALGRRAKAFAARLSGSGRTNGS